MKGETAMDSMDFSEVWEFGSTIFEDGFLAFMITIVVTYMIIHAIILAMQRTEKALGDKPRTNRSMALHYLFSTIRTILRVIGMTIVLSRIRMLKTVGAATLGATSVAAVAVSLAAQESFGNYISGFFLALYQPFKVGDMISLSDKGVFGTVSEITLRHIVLRTIENTTLIIPNSVMNTAVLENRDVGKRFYSGSVYVTVAYDTDFELAKQIIRQIVQEQPEFIDIRKAEEKKEGVQAVPIRVEELQDSGVQLRAFVRTTTYGGFFNAAGNIRQQIVERFRASGITIPYPIRTVELKQADPENKGV